MVETSATGKRIVGIVLAGGEARRLGGEKGLRLFGTKLLIEHVISRTMPGLGAIALNVNGDPARFRRFGLPIVADSVPGFPGPLGGILAGMDWAAGMGAESLVSFPCDAPFLPLDLVTRLAAARTQDDAEIAVAASGGRTHPVFALWPVRLRDELRHALIDEGVRKVGDWISRYHFVVVPFASAPVDPFFNINAPEDLAEGETLRAMLRSADNGDAGISVKK
ncbi:MAG: molybdenum cofactor guanylyltransferase MobA [Stellaceae bacterium]